MKKILIASHGEFARGAKQAIEFLLGERSDLFELSAYIDDESIINQIEEFFSNVDELDTVIVFSDLFGGSVNNSFIQFLDRANTYLIAGFNLALILDVLLKDYVDNDVINESIEAAREAIINVKLTETEVEDDFF